MRPSSHIRGYIQTALGGFVMLDYAGGFHFNN